MVSFKTYPNQKTWIDGNLVGKLKERDATYRHGKETRDSYMVNSGFGNSYSVNYQRSWQERRNRSGTKLENIFTDLRPANNLSIACIIQCPAEELPFADSSVDLMTAMSAFHWFDQTRLSHSAQLYCTADMEIEYGDCYHTLNTVCKIYAALLPYRNLCLGPSSVAFYKQSCDSIPYTEKECYKALLKKDPKRAPEDNEAHHKAHSPGTELLPMQLGPGPPGGEGRH
uniref:Methyltransferase type 11 domain-containing protein n=1 Tax=Hucho hucho TaxID=62062 RepID=A0A4W5QY88_9TELE